MLNQADARSGAMTGLGRVVVEKVPKSAHHNNLNFNDPINIKLNLNHGTKNNKIKSDHSSSSYPTASIPVSQASYNIT